MQYDVLPTFNIINYSFKLLRASYDCSRCFVFYADAKCLISDLKNHLSKNWLNESGYEMHRWNQHVFLHNNLNMTNIILQKSHISFHLTVHLSSIHPRIHQGIVQPPPANVPQSQGGDRAVEPHPCGAAAVWQVWCSSCAGWGACATHLHTHSTHPTVLRQPRLHINGNTPRRSE